MKVLDHRNFPYPSYHKKENDTYCDLTIWLDDLNDPTKAVIRLTELPENKGTSVTNRIRKIQELVREWYHAILTEVGENNITWIEHYLGDKNSFPPFNQDRYALIDTTEQKDEWKHLEAADFFRRVEE